jgi:hypothetical protein
MLNQVHSSQATPAPQFPRRLAHRKARPTTRRDDVRAADRRESRAIVLAARAFGVTAFEGEA